MAEPFRAEEIEHRRQFGGGVLSKGQYEYLLSDDLDLSATAERQRRRKIRNNFQSAIPDLALLQTVDDNDLFRIFAPLFNPEYAGIESDLAEHGVLSIHEVNELDLAELARGERERRQMMLEGMKQLFATLTYLFGLEDTVSIMERSLNEGQIRRALARGDPGPELISLNFEEEDPSDVISDYLESQL